MFEDKGIIKLILGGDVEAFRLLVERYEGGVFSLVFNIVGDRHICEDIVQDVFFVAYRKLGTFDSARSEFCTWLFTIARNKSINAIKKKRPVAVAELPEGVDSDGPAESVGRREAFLALEVAIGELPVKLKAVYVMAEFEGLAYHHIAQIEGISVGTVKSRVHRARKKLLAALKEFEGDFI